MPLLVALHGSDGSGKTTVEKHITSVHKYLPYAMARPLKRLCGELFDLSAEQMEDQTLKATVIPRLNCTPRYILQRIGTDLFRNHLGEVAPLLPYKSIWLDLGREWLVTHSDRDQVVSDARFENEIDMIHELGGLVIGIDRRERDVDDGSKEMGMVNGSWLSVVTEWLWPTVVHASEQLYFEKCDVVIRNDGTIEELQRKIDYYLFERELEL
jgi:hypothetical protein